MRPADVRFFREVLPDSVQQIESILRWTMMLTDSIDDPGVMTAEQAYEVAIRGGGLVCGQLASIFEAALTARGFTARRVQIVRSLFSEGDTHETVEVLVNGRWILYDPTFHVSYARRGQLLGAADLHAALLDGSLDQITPVFRGEVRYPARLETYYLDWRPLYNDVTVFDAGGKALWRKLPPMRYWRGPRRYYLNASCSGAVWQVSVVDDLYAFIIAGLPITILTIGLGVGVMHSGVRRRWRGSRAPEDAKDGHDAESDGGESDARTRVSGVRNA